MMQTKHFIEIKLQRSISFFFSFLSLHLCISIYSLHLGLITCSEIIDSNKRKRLQMELNAECGSLGVKRNFGGKKTTMDRMAHIENKSNFCMKAAERECGNWKDVKLKGNGLALVCK